MRPCFARNRCSKAAKLPLKNWFSNVTIGGLESQKWGLFPFLLQSFHLSILSPPPHHYLRESCRSENIASWEEFRVKPNRWFHWSILRTKCAIHSNFDHLLHLRSCPRWIFWRRNLLRGCFSTWSRRRATNVSVTVLRLTCWQLGRTLAHTRPIFELPL